MMAPVRRVNGLGADAIFGEVKYDIAKLSWNFGMIAAAIVFAPYTFSAETLLLFVGTSYFSLLIGHRVLA